MLKSIIELSQLVCYTVVTTEGKTQTKGVISMMKKQPANLNTETTNRKEALTMKKNVILIFN